MKTSNISLLLYLISDNINYLTINVLLVDNILHSLSNIQYQLKAIYYILSIILEKYFKNIINH